MKNTSRRCKYDQENRFKYCLALKNKKCDLRLEKIQNKSINAKKCDINVSNDAVKQHGLNIETTKYHSCSKRSVKQIKPYLSKFTHINDVIVEHDSAPRTSINSLKKQYF